MVVANAKSSNSGSESKKKTIYRYKMPKLYANFHKTAVVADLIMKRGTARDKMIIAMGYEEKKLPQAFPTEDQVMTRVSGLKYTHNGGKQRSKARKKTESNTGMDSAV